MVDVDVREFSSARAIPTVMLVIASMAATVSSPTVPKDPDPTVAGSPEDAASAIEEAELDRIVSEIVADRDGYRATREASEAEIREFLAKYPDAGAFYLDDVA